jgi:hypothetical protein
MNGATTEDQHMTPLFKKLNLGEHRTISVLGAPESFETELAALTGVTVVRSATQPTKVPFLLAFVKSLTEIEHLATKILPNLAGDVVLWLAYPKMSSKNYACDFNRDTGWSAVGAAGYEGVRQVAIDSDWSALRFRRIEYIKSFARSESMALSEEGKRRSQKPPRS